ncbi:MAG: DUF2804 family protein [Anaerolineales bacterium]|nr:DUF2804 family protein [Anaerolineales bacterium]
MIEPLQHELTEHAALLDQDGRLKQVGWSRQPLLDCNLENASFYWFRPLQRFRIKRWDYYGVTTSDFYFSATIADLGYAGQVFVYFVDFQDGFYEEQTITIPFARGVSLPQNSTEGESHYEGSGAKIRFEVEAERRQISLQWPSFGERGIAAEIQMHLTLDHESMVIVIPFSEKRFYYNRKVNCIPVEGSVMYRGKNYSLMPGTSLGNLDWGRGVWPYSSFWVWASASGFLADQRRIGLNLGFGFGDTSAATENAMILQGKIHKLGIVKLDYQPTDFMKPWRMTAPDGRLELTFEPFLDRVASTNLLLIASEVHQLFGRYHGWVSSDEGERIEINGLIGFAEEHYARW